MTGSTGFAVYFLTIPASWLSAGLSLPVFDICCQFIDRIEVSHTDKKSKTRKITIVYNFIGAFNFGRAKEKAQNTTQKQQRTA
ncbi:DUF4368 domain-containing protein [Brotocaccenecus cirricatena]|uniref:DUF4368 domain-containing protein n=1 Tax=Brotocaccenecus cirricatena TaxID=3064195 RepID=UPI003D73F00A